MANCETCKFYNVATCISYDKDHAIYGFKEFCKRKRVVINDSSVPPCCGDCYVCKHKEPIQLRFEFPMN